MTRPDERPDRHLEEEVLAVDVGGTKVAVSLIDAEGTIGAGTVVPTPRSLDPDLVFEPVAGALTEVLAQRRHRDAPHRDRALRVGISSAGPINGPAGTVDPVNIAGWRDFPLVARVAEVVKQATGRAPQVRLAGDGHCFALGEHWVGAGRDVSSMIGMVLSTGVGGGVVIDGDLFPGPSGNAVHLGHISVNAWGGRCVCGGHGCVELYARGPALVAAAHAAGWTGGDDALALTTAARRGDPLALDVIDYGMRALAAGIAATATEFDVRVVVLGGGVSLAGEIIFTPLRRHLADFATLPYVGTLEVRPAKLKNAGLLGAAALAFTL